MLEMKMRPFLFVACFVLVRPGVLPAQVVPVGKDLGVAPVVMAEVKRLSDDGAWWQARESLLARAAKGEEMEVLRGLSQEFSQSKGEVGRRAELVGREINASMDRRDRERRLALSLAAAREALARLKQATEAAERERSIREIESALARMEGGETKEGGAARTRKKEADDAGEKPNAPGTMTRFRLADGKEVMVPLPEGADADDYEAVMKDGQVLIKRKAKPAPKPKKDPEPAHGSGTKEG